MRPASSKWTLDLPENKEALMEELVKQESLLDHIHEGLTNQKHPGLEEQLWEVQRVVTQLKRKVHHKFLNFKSFFHSKYKNGVMRCLLSELLLK